MQYERAFSYQFEDQQWPTKLGLGALISMVPILNFALAGYMVAIMRNLAAHAPEPMPRWDDFGRKFRDGLLVALAGLVYAAPMLIALGIPVALLIASRGAAGRASLQDLSNALGAVAGLFLAVVVVVVVLYALVLSIIRPAILVIFSRDGTFASCFKLGEIIRLISQHASRYLLTWLAVILAGIGVGFVLSLVGAVVGWIPCIGWVPAAILGLGGTMYLITIEAHLFGQFRAAALQSNPVKLPGNGPESELNPGDLSS